MSNDWTISKTLPVRARLPDLPTTNSEESHFKWVEELGEYLRQAGYGKSALKTMSKGVSAETRLTLRKGFKKGGDRS